MPAEYMHLFHVFVEHHAPGRLVLFMMLHALHLNPQTFAFYVRQKRVS